MAIRDLRLYDGSTIQLDEWLHYPQYSVMEFAAGVKLNLRAFQYVSGNPVSSQGLAPRNSTDNDTNWLTKARTNYDEAFVVYGVTYEAFGLTAAPEQAADIGSPADIPMVSRHNLLVLERDVVVELYVGANQSKPQLRQPFSGIPQSVGVVVHGTSYAEVVDSASAYDVGTGGRVSANNQWMLNLPIYIESDRNLYLQCKTYNTMIDLNQAIRLRWWLDGMKRRPVA
jgi:hypothetical protein